MKLRARCLPAISWPFRQGKDVGEATRYLPLQGDGRELAILAYDNAASARHGGAGVTDGCGGKTVGVAGSESDNGWRNEEKRRLVDGQVRV